MTSWPMHSWKMVSCALGRTGVRVPLQIGTLILGTLPDSKMKQLNTLIGEPSASRPKPEDVSVLPNVAKWLCSSRHDDK